MSADPIVYCLEHLTDYRQFERLCTDLLSQSGFPNIEPIGGSSDGGRDALHVSRTNPEDVTIFAYSVRSDWRTKLLAEDCKRIKEEQHKLSRVVFACTSSITAGQRDSVIQAVRDEFGWELELFDIERLRSRLAGELRHLIAQHPAIFVPPFFQTRGGLSVAESRDTLVIDHLPNDHGLAVWLARRLQIAGFRVWCMGTAPLAGQNPDESIRALLSSRAERYFPVISSASISDVDFVTRTGSVAGRDGFIIPCFADEVNVSLLPSTLRNVAPIQFSKSWKTALESVLEALATSGIKPSVTAEQGKAIALRSYSPEPVVKVKPETVYANTFNTVVPQAIQVCELTKELTEQEILDLRKVWPFVIANSTTLLAFVAPPSAVPLVAGKRLPGYAWKHYPCKYEKHSVNVIKELVRRTLDVVCVQAGMQWCDDRKKFYFPTENKPQRSVPYIHVDGRKTRVAVTGQITYGSGEYAKPFYYQLCPIFSIGRDESEEWWTTLRIYVRVTEITGKPFEGKAIIRRRKKVTKSWWNQAWFARTLGVLQALETERGTISFGNSHQAVTVSTVPLSWECPVSIDYSVVDRIGDFYAEFAELRASMDEDEDTVSDVVEDVSDER